MDNLSTFRNNLQERFFKARDPISATRALRCMSQIKGEHIEAYITRVEEAQAESGSSNWNLAIVALTDSEYQLVIQKLQAEAMAKKSQLPTWQDCLTAVRAASMANEAEMELQKLRATQQRPNNTQATLAPSISYSMLRQSP